MADFLPCYEGMIRDEGGYKLHTVEGDRGGMTYAGIARNMNPTWEGWAYIDRGETPPTALVRDWYREAFWAPLRGDDILDQRIASSIFNFAVNTSAAYRPKLAIKLVQAAIGVTPDGSVGERTLAALNTPPEGLPEQFWGELFELRFFYAKVTRYAELGNNDGGRRTIQWGKSTAVKFLLGWINRAVKGAAR